MHQVMGNAVCAFPAAEEMMRWWLQLWEKKFAILGALQLQFARLHCGLSARSS